MKRTETCILTNMVMVYDEDNVLIQDRVSTSWPGITFPGGHVEPYESLVNSAIREVKEETGLTISDLQLCGIKQFTTEKYGGYRYLVFLYKTNRFSGTLTSSDEGETKWVSLSDLNNLNLASSFKEMLEVFLKDDISEHLLALEDGNWNDYYY